MWLKDKLLELLEKVYKKQKYLLLSRDLTGAPEWTSPRLQVVAIGPEHRDGLEQFIRRHHGNVVRSLRMIDTYLGRGFGGHMALRDGEIIGYRWWADRTMDHPQVALYGLTLGENDVYTFALYIARAFRGHDYAKELVAAEGSSLREKGYTRSFNSVDVDNTPARRVHEDSGARVIGSHSYVCFLSRAVYAHGKWLRYDPMWM